MLKGKKKAVKGDTQRAIHIPFTVPTHGNEIEMTNAKVFPHLRNSLMDLWEEAITGIYEFLC